MVNGHDNHNTVVEAVRAVRKSYFYIEIVTVAISFRVFSDPVTIISLISSSTTNNLISIFKPSAITQQSW